MQKDLGAMSTEEQRAAVMRDAPELAALLADLQSSLAEVRSRVGPLLKEVRIVAKFAGIEPVTAHDEEGYSRKGRLYGKIWLLYLCTERPEFCPAVN